MKKKTYKAMKNELYRQIRRAMMAEYRNLVLEKRVEDAEKKAQFYTERFRKLGSNVETVNPESDKLVTMLKWELDPVRAGAYMMIHPIMMEEMDQRTAYNTIRDDLANEIAKGLLESDMVQLFTKGQDQTDPLNPYGTAGAKLYVIPWEQMPHKRTVEIKQYVENTLEEGDTIK